MAQPIALTLPPRNPQHELAVRFEAAPAQHAEAILAAYEVLQLMHDKGVLELMRGTLGGGEAVVQEAVAVVYGPATIRASQNMFVLLKALGDVDPALLSAFTSAMSKALEQANREATKPPGLFTLLRSVFNADFRRGLAAFRNLLEIFGQNLTNKVGANAKQ